MVELPDSMRSIWSVFLELHNSRTFGYSSPNAILYSEILSYYALNQEPIEKWEVKVLRKLDGIVLQNYAEMADKERKAQAAKSK